MEHLKLVMPTMSHKDMLLDMRDAFKKAGESLAGGGGLDGDTTYETWLEKTILTASEATCPKERVVSTTYVATKTVDNKVVGIIQLRHHINHPILSTWGGHVGYSVSLNERKKGYATQMVKLILKSAKKLNIDKLLITCSQDNIGSKKVILNNGGVFEKTFDNNGDIVERYWLSIID